MKAARFASNGCLNGFAPKGCRRKTAYMERPQR
jgi:hypothetical protein